MKKTLDDFLSEQKIELDVVDIDKAESNLSTLLKSHGFKFSSVESELRHVFGGQEVVFSFVKPSIDDVSVYRLVYVYSDTGKLSVDAQIKPRKHLVGNNDTKMKVELLYKKSPLDTLIARHVEIIKDNL